MPLKGRAFMAIWHDIEASGEAEYSDWHTRQHMPERLGVPGFLAGRRGVDWDLAHQRWFTLYETRTLEVLSSNEYRARLNNPTPWSNRTQPNFRNFARSACILSASTGRGFGGAMATIRLNMREDELTTFEACAGRIWAWPRRRPRGSRHEKLSCVPPRGRTSSMRLCWSTALAAES
jgi:hypothetical protein